MRIERGIKDKGRIQPCIYVFKEKGKRKRDAYEQEIEKELQIEIES